MKETIRRVMAIIEKTFCIAFFLFLIFIFISLFYHIFILIKNRMHSYGVEVFFTEEWLGFWGSIIGSVMAIVGVVLTIKYELKRQNILYRDKVQPILILVNEKSEKCDENSSYTNILFCPFRRFFGEYIEINIPQMSLKNVGFNDALSAEILISTDYSKETTSKKIDYIGAKKVENVKIKIRVPKSRLKEIFTETYEILDKDSQIIFFEAMTHLKDHNIDDIEYVGITNIKLEINYNDVYGYTSYTTYYQVQLRTICCVEGYYETYSYITCLNNDLKHISKLQEKGQYRNC